MLHWERSQSAAIFGGQQGSCSRRGKQKEDTEHEGGREGSRKRAALPQTGYCAPLRGILNFNASKALHKKLHTFLPPTKYRAVEMTTTQQVPRPLGQTSPCPRSKRDQMVQIFNAGIFY